MISIVYTHHSGLPSAAAAVFSRTRLVDKGPGVEISSSIHTVLLTAHPCAKARSSVYAIGMSFPPRSSPGDAGPENHRLVPTALDPGRTRLQRVQDAYRRLQRVLKVAGPNPVPVVAAVLLRRALRLWKPKMLTGAR